MATELERERDALEKAGMDIAEGQDRIARQAALISEMRAKGLDCGEGERLLILLSQTLSHWEQHREMIVERISYLEGKSGAISPAGPLKTSGTA